MSAILEDWNALGAALQSAFPELFADIMRTCLLHLHNPAAGATAHAEALASLMHARVQAAAFIPRPALVSWLGERTSSEILAVHRHVFDGGVRPLCLVELIGNG